MNSCGRHGFLFNFRSVNYNVRTGECALSEMDRSSVANPSEDFKVRLFLTNSEVASWQKNPIFSMSQRHINFHSQFSKCLSCLNSIFLNGIPKSFYLSGQIW